MRKMVSVIDNHAPNKQGYMHILIHPQYMYHKITKLLIGKFVLIKPVLTCIVFRKHSYFEEINTIFETINFKTR